MEVARIPYRVLDARGRAHVGHVPDADVLAERARKAREALEDGRRALVHVAGRVPREVAPVEEERAAQGRAR